MKNTIFGAAALLIFANPALAATEAECTAMWKQADINADGALSVDESVRYSAMMRIAEKTMPTDGIIAETMFTESCMDSVFDTAEMDTGAPLSLNCTGFTGDL